MGKVTGGGSQLGQFGEIEFVDIEMRVARLDDALPLVVESLERSGAPVESELIGEAGVLPGQLSRVLAGTVGDRGLLLRDRRGTDVRAGRARAVRAADRTKCADGRPCREGPLSLAQRSAPAIIAQHFRGSPPLSEGQQNMRPV